MEAKESSTVQNSLTDLISKKTLDLNNNGLSARKKLKKSGLDITIGVTSTQPVKQVNRLNIEIDPDQPLSSKSNNKSESTVRTPVITQKS